MAEKGYPPPQAGFQAPPGYSAATQPGYPGPGQPQAPGYPPQPGYPPTQQPGYPPQQPGYPPQQPGYPPQQPGYPPQQPGYPMQGQPPPYTAQTTGGHVAQQTTVVIAQPTITAPAILSFGESPTQVVCPQCRAQVVTSINYVDGTCVWLLCVILFFLGIWPCCLIPFCVTGCKDVHHTCPNCHRMIGAYRRM